MTVRFGFFASTPQKEEVDVQTAEDDGVVDLLEPSEGDSNGHQGIHGSQDV